MTTITIKAVSSSQTAAGGGDYRVAKRVQQLGGIYTSNYKPNTFSFAITQPPYIFCINPRTFTIPRVLQYYSQRSICRPLQWQQPAAQQSVAGNQCRETILRERRGRRKAKCRKGKIVRHNMRRNVNEPIQTDFFVNALFPTLFSFTYRIVTPIESHVTKPCYTQTQGQKFKQ